MPVQKSHNCANLKISILYRILTAGMMMSQINLTHSLQIEEKHKTSVIIPMTYIILVYFFVYLIILYQLQKNKGYAAENNRNIMANELEIML